jgi:hypothetical protein
MRQRGYRPPSSGTKNLETSVSGDSRSIRSDSNRQPFVSGPGSHGTVGTVHAGTPQSTVTDISATCLYCQRTAFNSFHVMAVI